MSNDVRCAVIPAAGLGTRFLPATKAQPKEMLPVVDKPAIQYVVEEAVQAGIDDILIITGRGKRSIEDHFDRQFELEYFLEAKGKDRMLTEVRDLADLADIHYVRQGEPRGLGHAVSVARKHVGDRAFAVMLGDDLMVDDSKVLRAMIEAHGVHDAPVVALREVPEAEISSYGCADIGGVDPGHEPGVVQIHGIIEKPSPAEAPSSMAVMGRYVFTPEIFDILDHVQPGVGGEIQLTDAIAESITTGDVFGYAFSEGRYDIGAKLDYLRATVELALQRDDLGAPFEAFLTDLMARRAR